MCFVGFGFNGLGVNPPPCFLLRFSFRLLGLLLNKPLGRRGGGWRPNCVGVGGRSGSSNGTSGRMGGSGDLVGSESRVAAASPSRLPVACASGESVVL